MECIYLKGRGRLIINQANSIQKDLVFNNLEKEENLHESPNGPLKNTGAKQEEVARHFGLLFVLCGSRGTHLKQNVIG